MIDPELLPGARNAIRVCLNVQPHERVTVITDEIVPWTWGAFVIATLTGVGLSEYWPRTGATHLPPMKLS